MVPTCCQRCILVVCRSTHRWVVSGNICEISRALPHKLHPNHRGHFEYSKISGKIDWLRVQSLVAAKFIFSKMSGNSHLPSSNFSSNWYSPNIDPIQICLAINTCPVQVTFKFLWQHEISFFGKCDPVCLHIFKIVRQHVIFQKRKGMQKNTQQHDISQFWRTFKIVRQGEYSQYRRYHICRA